jgi:hypothetical protein
MDIFSHLLINNLIFKELPREQKLLAVAFGVLPDLISFVRVFGVDFVKKILFYKKAPKSIYPKIVHEIYDLSHSLIVWLAVFSFLYFFNFKWLAVAYCGWGLHILIDVFTHNEKTFPTHIFWPFSKFHFTGFTWGYKAMAINYIIMFILYWLFYFN